MKIVIDIKHPGYLPFIKSILSGDEEKREKGFYRRGLLTRGPHGQQASIHIDAGGAGQRFYVFCLHDFHTHRSPFFNYDRYYFISLGVSRKF